MRKPGLQTKLTLTIVIPVYNEENHLGYCLESIKEQTVMPQEVIVVDNNSSDKSMTIAKAYSFVRIIKESQQGIAHARNKGFNAAKTDLMGRIDGDTVLPTDWVERVLRFYQYPENSQRALTGGGYFYNVRWPRFNGWVQSQLAYRTNRFIVGFYILWGSNMALPAELWRAVRQDTCNDFAVHEDLDLAIHLHRRGYQIVYDASLQVGVYLKRVWEDQQAQNEHLARWPSTLKNHSYRRWWLSLGGNFGLKYIVKPFAFTVEAIARLSGRERLPGRRK